MAAREEDNFLSQFGEGAVEGDGTCEAQPGDGDEDLVTSPTRRTGDQALPASWERPKCDECGQEDGPQGGGRYGFADHEGLFFCGRCWRAWDQAEQEKIMKPAYLQKQDVGLEVQDVDNFFDRYEGGEGTDEIGDAWEPGQDGKARDGEQALPASWEAPTCVQCGREEGEEGGGRYRRDGDGDAFFCGRCWRSWDSDAQRKMMMGYAPTCFVEPFCSAPDAVAAPIVDCPPPDAALFGGDDDDWYEGAGEGKEGLDEAGEWEGDFEEGDFEEGADFEESAAAAGYRAGELDVFAEAPGPEPDAPQPSRSDGEGWGSKWGDSYGKWGQASSEGWGRWDATGKEGQTSDTGGYPPGGTYGGYGADHSRSYASESWGGDYGGGGWGDKDGSWSGAGGSQGYGGGEYYAAGANEKGWQGSYSHQGASSSSSGAAASGSGSDWKR